MIWLLSSSAASVSLSVPAAITKFHTLGSLINEHLFHTVLEAGKPQIKALAFSVLGEGAPPGFVHGHFLAVSSHGGESERVLVPLLLRRTLTNLITGAPFS